MTIREYELEQRIEKLEQESVISITGIIILCVTTLINMALILL